MVALRTSSYGSTRRRWRATATMMASSPKFLSRCFIVYVYLTFAELRHPLYRARIIAHSLTCSALLFKIVTLFRMVCEKDRTLCIGSAKIV